MLERKKGGRPTKIPAMETLDFIIAVAVRKHEQTFHCRIPSLNYNLTKI